MAETAEIKMEVTGADAAANEVKKVGDAAKQASKDAEAASKDLKRAFSGAVIGDVLGKLGQEIDGIGGAALRSAEMFAKGWAAGGPVAAAGFFAAGVYKELIKAEEDYQRATAAAHEEAIRQAERERAQMQPLLDEKKKLATEERALAIMREKGVSRTIALAQAEAEASATSREDGQAKLRELRERIDRENALLVEQSQTLQNFEAKARAGGYVNSARLTLTGADEAAVRESLQEQVNAQRATVDALKAQRDGLSQAMIGADIAESNKRKALQLATEQEKLETQRSANKARRDEAKQSGIDMMNDAVALFREEQNKIASLRLDEMEAMQRASEELSRIQAKQTEERLALQDERDKERRAEGQKRAKDAQAAYQQEQAVLIELDKAANDERRKAEEEQARVNQEFLTAAIGTGEKLSMLALEFADAKKREAKETYETRAQQAGIEAAYATATGFLQLALGNAAGATSAFLSAAQFAAIAGGNLLASTGARSQSEIDAEAKREKDKEKDKEKLGTSGRGRGGSGQAMQPEIVIIAGNGRVMNAEIGKAARAARLEGERRR